MINLLRNYKRKVDLNLGEIPYSEYTTNDGRITYYNWWECNPKDMWFTRFIRKHFPEQKHKINFYSVFGKNRFINRSIEGKKVFFSGENIDDENSLTNWKTGNYCLENVDLSLGFGEILDSKYLRFPLWILYVFPPESDEMDIIRIIEDIDSACYNKTKECAVIARHDNGKTRQMICDGIGKILDIQYAGTWRNNTQDLWKKFNDDKIACLKNFKFNICPENVDTKLYVTEKIFQAFLTGAIPIYHGANGTPEPNVINKNAIILWKDDEANEIRKHLSNLKHNEEYYSNFLRQDRLLPTAAEYVIDKFNKFKMKLEEIM